MSSDLMTIARSGASAARRALEVTSQNIANVGTEGYVRRTATLSEVAGSGTMYYGGDVSLHGVRLSGIVRNADAFRTSEVRRTTADFARANAEIGALTNVQTALEQSDVSGAIASFEASLKGLKADPTNPALRAVVMENARSIADALNTSAASLDAARAGLHADAADGVSQLNQLSSDLSKLNTRLLRTPDGTSDQAALLDQRDRILQSMSEIAGVGVAIGPHQTATVTLGGVSIVDANGPTAVGVGTAPDGSFAFDVGGAGVSITAGSLAGTSLGLNTLNDARARLDTIATSVISAVNGAQASGVALDGTPGQPLMGGTGAANIAMLTMDGAALATAPAGAPANSRDVGNLDTLINAVDGSNASKNFDGLLSEVSSAIAGRSITRDALGAIADSATAVFASQAGVSLDDEAANLMRFQQAFQASGRVMQTANDLFDSILSIR